MIRRHSIRPVFCLLAPISLPRALRHTRDITFERQLAEAEAAHVELSKESPWTSAPLATIAVTNLVLQRLGLAGHLCGSSHSLYTCVNSS